VRFAVRLFAKHRMPALAVIVTLAAALGLNASVFAVADALVIRPFSFPDLDTLVLVSETQPDNRAAGVSLTSAPNFLDWRDQSRTLQPLSAVTIRDVELGARPDPERLRAAFVSANFFEVLGVAPALGRGFL